MPMGVFILGMFFVMFAIQTICLILNTYITYLRYNIAKKLLTSTRKLKEKDKTEDTATVKANETGMGFNAKVK